MKEVSCPQNEEQSSNYCDDIHRPSQEAMDRNIPLYLFFFYEMSLKTVLQNILYSLSDP